METSAVKRFNPSGQALVEFVMVMPLLLLLLLGSFAVGLGIYQGASASMAIKEPVNKKINLAKNKGVSTTDAENLVKSFKSGNLDSGNSVDTVNFVETDKVTSVIVANKRFTPPVPFLPTVDFTVTQGINTSALGSNPTTTTPTLSGGAPVDMTGASSAPANECNGPGVANTGAFPNTIPSVNALYGVALCTTTLNVPSAFLSTATPSLTMTQPNY